MPEIAETTTDTPPDQTLVSESEPQTPPPSTPAEAPPPSSAVAGPWIKQDGSFVSDWTHADDIKQIASNPEELKTLAKYGTVKDLARGLVHANRLIGQKGVLLPSEHSTPEEVAEYRKATGVPEKIEEYQVKPEQLPEGIQWDDNYAKPFVEIAHKNNIPPRVMKQMVEAHIQMEQQRGQATIAVAQQQAEQKYRQDLGSLQQAWGKDFEFNRRKVVAAAEAEGCPIDDPGFMSPNMCKLIFNLARSRREDSSVSPTAVGSGMTPGERARDIQNNPDNPDYSAYRGIGREPDPAVQNKVRALLVEEERRKASLSTP